MRNYYEILQIPEKIDNSSIGKIYRKLALKTHPDVNSSNDAHQKFIELNEAYSVLKDPFRRKKYDELLNLYRNSENQEKLRRADKWETNINRAARRGGQRGKKYAQQSENKFKRRRYWWILEILGEIIGRVLFGLIELIAGAFS